MLSRAKMNVLLLIIDALTPSHLSLNGYFRKTSPNIDKLAKNGTIFSNTYTVLPRSDPSVVSMLTGLYPHSHGIRLISNKKVLESISTLPEILQNHGYKTAFIKPGSEAPKGYGRGFADFDLLSWKIKNKIRRGIYKVRSKGNFLGRAEQYFSTAVKWIKKNSNKPFFLVVHTNDLHWPYPVPKPYDHMFDPDYKGNHDYDTTKSNKYTRGEIAFGHANLPKEEINHAIAHYDGGIRYIDEQLGKLFDFLRNEDLMNDTLIILSSDHGEHFGEHNAFFQHGSSLYEPSIKSTLILHNPRKIPAGKRIGDRVQVLDIMPTILDFLKISLIENVEGHSLFPLVVDEKKSARDFIFVESAEEYFKGNPRVFFEGNRGKWRALIVNDWKLIYIPHPKNDIFELYNLMTDPEENHNLADKEREKLEELKKRLFDFMKGQSMEGNVNIEDLSAKSRKLLVKAGYLDSDQG